MRKYVHTVVILLLCVVFFFLLISRTDNTPTLQTCPDDAKLCPDGSVVGRIAPLCDFSSCPNTHTATHTDSMINVTTPSPNQTVTSPVLITGSARGNWYFEGSFPVSIVNWDGLIIGSGIATAQDNWMTTEFVPFTATISYEIATGTPYSRGSLILKKDNPSGLPENDDAREIPIILNPQ